MGYMCGGRRASLVPDLWLVFVCRFSPCLVPDLCSYAVRERDAMDFDDDAPTCSICYASAPEVTHRPCGHAEFCMMCSLHCEVCPLCRVTIDQREPLLSNGETHNGGALSPSDENTADNG